MKEYNFIVSFSFLDVYDIYFDQVRSLSNAIFVNIRENNWFKYIIEKLMFSKKAYIFFPDVLRQIWLRKKVKKWGKKFANSKNELCFVFPLNYFRYNGYGITEAVKDCFCDAKIVYFFTDLISLVPERQRCVSAVGEADLTYSYDYKEAVKYNLLYHALPYSDIFYMIESIKCEHDICFIGQAKNRLEEIIEVFIYLSSKGIDCDFYIMGAEKECQKYANKIHYLDTFLSYKECLKITAQSKCILEIVQKNSTGNTPRVPEAIFLRKRLISNNQQLPFDHFFDFKNMKVYSEVTDIDINFIRSDEEIVYGCDKSRLLPESFFKDITIELNKKQGVKDEKSS